MVYKLLLVCSVLLILLLGFHKVLADDTEIGKIGSKLTVVKTSPEFERISHCESNGNLQAKNKYSSASGEFQFLWSTWYHYGIEYWGKDFYTKNIWSTDNRDLAWYVYSTYGNKDWKESSNCWKR